MRDHRQACLIHSRETNPCANRSKGTGSLNLRETGKRGHRGRGTISESRSNALLGTLCRGVKNNRIVLRIPDTQLRMITSKRNALHLAPRRFRHVSNLGYLLVGGHIQLMGSFCIIGDAGCFPRAKEKLSLIQLHGEDVRPQGIDIRLKHSSVPLGQFLRIAACNIESNQPCHSFVSLTALFTSEGRCLIRTWCRNVLGIRIRSPPAPRNKHRGLPSVFYVLITQTFHEFRLLDLRQFPHIDQHEERRKKEHE